ncbi:alpha/beta fold hydrolase [Shimia marina]|uniref:Tropinesterase n=1 Tax=Shimia marina TaxID=321267 RepID=A0A0P1EUL6_9RHOB|nr:alpha/beta hydrolase [Shimia marina]CUH54082.1 Tropinesterase [Shimia marina]SFE59972.1 Pimeloyl-ACP methyl ester carboxylesterase [Shimia marina]
MPHFTTSDGLSLYYDDTGGPGPAVLCLSGLTRNATDFDYVLPHLKDARVIRMDYRGRGQSDWADHSTYTLPREAQDALELMDHLGLAKTAILGTSRGGLIALTLAEIAPERLTGVCFNDIGPVIETAGLEVILVFIGRKPFWKTRAEAAEALASRLPGFANVPASRWAEEAAHHFVPTDTGLDINYDPKLRNAVLAEFDPRAPASDMWPQFDKLAGRPLAALRGINSDILSRDTFEHMQARAPMFAAEVADRAHVPFLDEPESLAVLTDWIATLPPQDPS